MMEWCEDEEEMSGSIKAKNLLTNWATINCSGKLQA
jgi:hypothetical protein